MKELLRARGSERPKVEKWMGVSIGIGESAAVVMS